MSISEGLVIGPTLGLTSGINPTITEDGGDGDDGGGVDVTQDNGIYFPQSAAEWEALELTAPDHLYIFQEAEGSLLDQIASLDMTPDIDEGGSIEYEESIGGDFTRNGILLTSPAVSLDRTIFENNSKAFDITEDESFSFLVYAVHPSVATFMGYHFVSALSNKVRCTNINESRFRLQVTGPGNLEGSEAVTPNILQPFLGVIDRGAEASKFYTLDEAASGDEPGALEGTNFFLGVSNTNASEGIPVLMALAAVWQNVTFDQTLLETLGWELAY